MPTLINTILQTGRLILALERQQACLPTTAGALCRINREHRALVRRQQDEIVAAIGAGVDLQTIEGALRLHGQHADRPYPPPDRTPADELGELLAEQGTNLIATLDGYRSGRSAPSYLGTSMPYESCSSRLAAHPNSG